MKQVALVTGSSRGIGLGTAKALAAEGFAVALNGPEDNAELSAAVQEVAELGNGAIGIPFDVIDAGAYDAAMDKAEQALGPLTTLVNNAGVGVLSRGDPLDVSEESWDRCLTINSKAVFFLTQAFAKRLIDRQRPANLVYSIVNVTSSNADALAVPLTPPFLGSASSSHSASV